MRVDTTKSRFHEAVTAPDDFDRVELRRLRLLLRRLRFLEMQVEQRVNDDAGGGAQFAEWEVEALEFVLTELEYLVVTDA